MKNIILNNGVKMPILGFGVYQILDEKICEEAVLNALQAGYRLIDTAAAYKNEEAVGRAIKRSGIPREEIFVTTKLWIQDATYEGAKRGFETSLRNLGLDYIDLYLIHQPYNDVYGAWRAMSELYKEGKIKAIGVSNFQRDRLVDFILNNEVIPAVNQIQVHPFRQKRLEKELLDEYGVQMEAWAPFAEGQNNIFKNEIIGGIAEKYNKTIAQVILRWHIQRGVVAIPKSVHKERIIENFDIWDFELDEDDMKIMATLEPNKDTSLVKVDPTFVKNIIKYKIHD